VKKKRLQGKTKNSFLLTSFNFLFVFFIFSFLFFSSQPVFAQTSSDTERITSFGGEVKINSDSTVDVRETLNYDFGGAEKHGIFRFIPIKYKARGGNFNLRISNINVNDENGNPYNYAISYSGNDIEIKIGDANKLVSGAKTYIISYTIRRAINYFSDHDELYWNFTGNKWEIPIENATLKVSLPVEAKDNLQYKCYQGAYGNNAECSASANGNIISYQSGGTISPPEGMTIVAGWPKGITAKPSMWQNILDVAKDNWTLFVPIIVFILMYRHWNKKGRDPKGRRTIIAQYEPPDKLVPAEVGTLIDGSADNKDVSATIIDLAVKKFLKIKRTEEKGFLGKNIEYTFIRLKDEDPEKDFEKTVIRGLFSGGTKETKLSDLKNKFYKDLNTAKGQLYKGITEKGYYVSNPNTTRILWMTLGIFATIGLIALFANFQGAFGFIAGFVSGVIILVFGWLMPAVTMKGARIKEDILGFKDFLSVTETDRLKFHNAPEKNPQMFEKFLPYAMVFGVEKEWSKQFEGIYNQQPDWYEDSSGRMFSALILADIVSDFNSSAMSTIASQPSQAAGGGSGFGGGGFSGGGFGGGGGGSW
jgi:uncharacterized membrane protein